MLLSELIDKKNGVEAQLVQAELAARELKVQLEGLKGCLYFVDQSGVITVELLKSADRLQAKA